MFSVLGTNILNKHLVRHLVCDTKFHTHKGTV
jgi:hypothetical protein